MSRTGKTFWLTFFVLLVPAWFFQRYLEGRGWSDVIGIWYSAYCSLFWALIVAVAAAVVSRTVMR